MGLKTTNYEVKELGMTLPEAYALIQNISVMGETGSADIAIQSTRENAMRLRPIKTVTVTFSINRNESPYITAYKAATTAGKIKVPSQNGGIETITIPAPFDGWEDDITTL